MALILPLRSTTRITNSYTHSPPSRFWAIRKKRIFFNRVASNIRKEWGRFWASDSVSSQKRSRPACRMRKYFSGFPSPGTIYRSSDCPATPSISAKIRYIPCFQACSGKSARSIHSSYTGKASWRSTFIPLSFTDKHCPLPFSRRNKRTVIFPSQGSPSNCLFNTSVSTYKHSISCTPNTER